MRLTCYLCILILVALGICGGVFAFSGVDILYFACFKNPVIHKSVLAVGFAAAIFSVYALVVFKPFKGLK